MSFPAFIIGVPRSGTTLLRTMLDSHPAIAAGPETPWLCNHQPRSLGALVDFLCADTHGFCASYGGSRAEVIVAARAFAEALLSSYARRRGRRRWVEKTPENLLHLPFLTELFPDARYIHLSRDALDVALSTAVVAPHRKGISDRLEKRLKLAPGLEVDNTVFAAALRRNHWERKIETGLAGRAVLRIRYEELVRDPEPAMRRMLDFLGEPFHPAVLDPASAAHDFPEWEWGSADVAHHARAGAGINAQRAGRAERELSAVELEILRPIAGRPAPAPPMPLAARPTRDQASTERFTRFAAWLNALAAPLGLETIGDFPASWSAPWLWFNGMAHISWPGTHLLAVHVGASPLPWLAALLGARATLVEPTPAHVPLWDRLRRALGVPVEWHIAPREMPLSAASADVALDLSGSRPGTPPPNTSAVLKPAGVAIAASGLGTEVRLA